METLEDGLPPTTDTPGRTRAEEEETEDTVHSDRKGAH